MRIEITRYTINMLCHTRGTYPE